MRRYMRGVAAVEFAILAIPLVTLAFGITEIGRAIYSYNTLVKSVRDAARFLTSQAPGDPTKHAMAKSMAVYGAPNCTGCAPLASGLTTGMIQTCDSALPCEGVTNTLPTGSGIIKTVTVRIVGYPYNSLVEFVVSDMNFNNISITMRSHL
ncbi:MAG: TadE/TadG family type IV pilus assembly protein [Aromatoleum sp.]|uniref:TadE/TadG family type IV pilus assembly protein n=1 Tax=Aromatoleum sp. TaxID=2307007 RepID=UPI002896166C|nr:TadE/TadG family type IV pilus assembly protein [Aromatoleum sp.]MDT3670307.1 TadE/TadG family type IV pilus assembly protein [Aromatoleum sp.]